jgi:RHS repeat-associated protein
VKGSSTVASQIYGYDVNANRTRDEKGSEAYNSRNQLVGWTRAGAPGGSVSYVLNGAGAVLRVTDSAGPDTVNTVAGDRLIEATTTLGATSVTSEYGYDGFGNLLNIHKQGEATDANDVRYVYDAFQRMISSRDPASSAATTSYTYDGLDRRDTKAQSGTTTTYGYVGSSNDLSLESTAAENTKRSYDYDAVGERQGQQVVATSSTYRSYVVDAQGSVQGFEDPATGEIQSGTQYRYDPYGVPQDTGLNQTGQDNPFRFQGFYYDPTAGGYNALAREYRPDIQRFLTQDRYEAAGSDLQLAANALTSDRYAFVAGNPTTNVEEDGHCVRSSQTRQCYVTGDSAATDRGQRHNKRVAEAERKRAAQDAPYWRAYFAGEDSHNLTNIEPAEHAPLGIPCSGPVDVSCMARQAVEDTVNAGKHIVRCQVIAINRPADCTFEQNARDNLAIASLIGGPESAAVKALLERLAGALGKRLAEHTAAKAGTEGVGAMRRLEYEASPKHGRIDVGGASRAPVNGQGALDYSLQVGSNSPRRIGIDCDAGNFVVFDRNVDAP